MPNKLRYPTSGSSTRPVPAYLTSAKTIGAASIQVNVATGWPTGDIDIQIFRKTSASSSARPEPVPGTVTSWTGNLSGTTVGSLILRAGTDQEYAQGELTVVMVAPTAAWGYDVISSLAESHNLADGTMKTSLPLTTPKITTSINDANGNEVIKTPSTASAVNEITVTNAATGNAPAISATGGDTNINLNLSAKGTGKVILPSNTVTQSMIDATSLSSYNFIRLSASTNTSLSTTPGTVNLLTTSTSRGTALTASSSRITIGSGISFVKVSAAVIGESMTSGAYLFSRIRRERATLFEELTMQLNIASAGGFVSNSHPPEIFPVQAGDIFDLRVDSSVTAGSLSSTRPQWLQIEAML